MNFCAADKIVSLSATKAIFFTKDRY